MQAQRLFSGIQPTGNIHLGNYLGAIHNWIALQEEHDAFFCIVDLHAITVEQDPEILRKNILDLARVYLAAGLDPAQATIFVQSDVHAHSELAWILNCTVARMGDLEKMTQFKDKARTTGTERSSVGLFDYPVLMAADILLYDTHIVPVGEDQVQHVELTRTLAKRFNKKYGETFVIPRAEIGKTGKRIMGLDNPEKKMSKSATSIYNYIALTDDQVTVEKKISKAVTDSVQGITYSDDRLAVKNLITIYSLLDNKSPEEIVTLYHGKGFGEFKADLARVISAFLMPLQKRMAQISDEDLRQILAHGAKKAGEIAQKTHKHAQQKVGIGL